MPHANRGPSIYGKARRSDVAYCGIPGLNTRDPAARHIAMAALRLKRLGFDPTDQEVIDRAIAVGRREHENERLNVEFRGSITVGPHQPGLLVYYMRIGNRVKIGWTKNLKGRLKSIFPEELMAVEYGGQAVEAERHGQFADLRTRGEWFRLEYPLTDHIAALREEEAWLNLRSSSQSETRRG